MQSHTLPPPPARVAAPVPLPRQTLQEVSDEIPVVLSPISDTQNGFKSWREELAEVRKDADDLRDMYHDSALDRLQYARSPQQRRTALLVSAIISDEWGPVEKNSAFSLLQSLNKEAASEIQAKAAATKPAAAYSKKRKSETSLEEDIAAYKQNLDHIDVDNLHVDQDCDQVRKQVNQVLDNAIVKKGEFCGAIGISNNSVNTFLRRCGPMEGIYSKTYINAWAWLKRRELAGLKMPDVKRRQKAAAAAAGDSGASGGPVAKKSKTSAASDATVDVSRVHLPGEETDSVPVFETADEIRKKISAHLETPGLTQAQFCRDLYAQLHATTCEAIQTKQLNDFRFDKSAQASCYCLVYYAAYVYFEKLRIAQGKPKSAHRVDMEWSLPSQGIGRRRAVI